MSSPFYPYPDPSSLPSPLSSLLPSIAQQTSGLALTPGTNPFLYPQPNQPHPPSLPGLSSLPGGGPQGGSHSGTSVRSGNVRRDEISLEDTLRGLEEGGVLLERARGVLDEIGRIQGNVFLNNGVGGSGDGGRLDLLQIEYNQIINTLYLLSISTSFGALPLLLPSNPDNTKTTIPTTNPTGSSTEPSNPIGSNTKSGEMNTSELIVWCENRAGLEFSRREGVKNGSKVVLDIMKARS